MKKTNLNVIHLGLTNYKSTWDLQKKLFDLRIAGHISDVFLLNEHHHVYTLGKTSDENHLLADENQLTMSGAEVFHIDRGGDVTYHGPGQLVGYPILNLNDYYNDIHRYLRDLEEVIMRTLSDFGINAERDSEFTGVWVGGNKIAALGVKVSRWVTMHGFALNVNTDLSYFDRIIPCGIFHKGVTSIEQLLGKPVLLEDVSQVLIRHFKDVFRVMIAEQSANDFFDSLQQLQVENIEYHQ